jgi:hypothetical protein
MMPTDLIILPSLRPFVCQLPLALSAILLYRSAARVQKKLLIPVGARDAARALAQDAPAHILCRAAHAFDGFAVQGRIAHNPAFADVFALKLELGFYKDEQVRSRFSEGRDLGQDLGNGDE